LAGVTVAATAPTLLESSEKVEVIGEIWTPFFYVPPEEEIIGIKSEETRCPSDMTACANILWKTSDTRTSELQCENM
jgi:hypothetical protein